MSVLLSRKQLVAVLALDADIYGYTEIIEMTAQSCVYIKDAVSKINAIQDNVYFLVIFYCMSFTRKDINTVEVALAFSEFFQ